MSSPKAPRTPLKPTEKANGTPKSPDSIHKTTSTQPGEGNVVKKRVPSQNVKGNAPALNKPASPQTPRPKPPKSSENHLPQTPTPDRSSKRQSTTDAPPPKFKAAASGQGDAAKPVIKKVKKASPPPDVETEKRDHIDGVQNEVKKAKKQAPPLQKEPEKLQNDTEKPKPKFKGQDLDVGETPKPVVKKKGPTTPPPELELEPEHQDEAVFDHDEVEHEDNEDEGENDYHEESAHEEEPEEGDSEGEGHNGEEAGSDWDGEQETHDDDGDYDYQEHGEGGHDYGTDREQDTQSQHDDKLSEANEESNNPAPAITNKASKATKDIKHKARKTTPATSGTTAAKNSELLEDLVAEPAAVFEDDADALGVSQEGASDSAADSQGVNLSRVAENATQLRSGGGGGIGITANGIEINVQTTKEGTSVTIKIPGASQQ